jgi:hypothetical protein
MEDVHVVEGDPVSFKCHVNSSIPKSNFGWKHSDESQYLISSKNSNLEIIESDNSFNSTDAFSQLVIKKTSRQDERTFTCLAKNKVGEDQKNVKLIVEYKPTFNKLSQNLKEVFFSWALDDEKKDQFISQKFTCIVQAQPVTKIVWFFNEQILDIENSTFLIEEEPNFSQLIVNPISISNFGNYRCKIRNKHGSLERTFTLKLGTKPESPPQLEVIAVYSRSVVLDIRGSFVKEDSMPIEAYKIQWIIFNSTNFSTPYEAIYYLNQHDYKNQNRIIIEIKSLLPDTRYVFRAASVNKAGNGAFTSVDKMVEVKTLPALTSKIFLAFMFLIAFILLLLVVSLILFVLSEVFNFIFNRIKTLRKYKRLIVRV